MSLPRIHKLSQIASRAYARNGLDALACPAALGGEQGRFDDGQDMT